MGLDPIPVDDGRSRFVTCFLALLTTVVALVAHTPARSEESQIAHLQIELGDHAGAVRRIAVAEKRDLLLTGADDKTTRSWSLASGQPLRVFRTPVGENEAGRVYGVAVHPTQPWIAIGGTSGGTSGGASGDASAGRHAIHIVDAVSGQHLRWIDARGGDIKRLCWSADGTLLIAAYAGAHGIRAFDTNGAMVFEERFDAAVYALATSPQGLLGGAAFDGTLRIYEASGGRVERRASLTAPAPNAVAASFSPDGKSLVLGYFASGKAPDIVDWQSGATRALPAPARMKIENLMSVAWSARTGHVFAAGTYGFAQRKVMLVEYDSVGARVVREETVARFSIADLAPLEDGRIAFAATDGSWGVTGAPARPSRLPDLTGPENLRVATDGQRISWTLNGGSTRVLFDLGRREVR